MNIRPDSDTQTALFAAPEDFFVPGLDRGCWFVQPETLSPQMVARGDVRALVLGSWVKHRLQTRDHLTKILRDQTWSQAALYPTLLALTENLSFADRAMRVNGKFLLNAAGGARLRQRYRTKTSAKGAADADATLTNHLAKKRLAAKAIPVTDDSDWRSLPLVVETRNFFNFYHFTKEALPFLTLYARYGLTGEVHIVGPASDERGFVAQEIAAWFPEIADRVRLIKGSAQYERALIPLDSKSVYPLSNGRVFPEITTSGGDRVIRRPSIVGGTLLTMNGAEEALVDLRAKTAALLSDVAGPKRRFYVGRRSDRVRPVGNEKRLLRRLGALGFETIYFEDYSVVEQARLMRAAEAVVMPHGAGLTNMLFVPEGAHVFELSNLQTLLKRYGSFNPLALVAGAVYHHIFFDHDMPDRRVMPSMHGDGHRGIAMSNFETDAFAAYVCAQLEPEAFALGFETCKGLNDAGDHAALATALETFGVCIAHTPDFHVWSANVAAKSGDRRGALDHLRRALVLAHDREPLLERILLLSRALHEEATFHEAALIYADGFPTRMAAFFAAQGWPAEIDETKLAPTPL